MTGPENVVLRASTDAVKRDLEVTCDLCGVVICDAEDGDSLDLLVGTAADHVCDNPEEGT
jgi:hypothetical protein